MTRDDERTTTLFGWAAAAGLTAAAGIAAVGAPIPAFFTAIFTCGICAAHVCWIRSVDDYTTWGRRGEAGKTTGRGVPDNVPFFVSIASLGLMIWITGPGSEPGTWPSEYKTFAEWRNGTAAAECSEEETEAEITRLCTAYLENRD